MDKIFISGLKIQTTIGFYDWEKTIKQTLLIDLVMGWDIRPAAADDDLAKTLDYAEISQLIERFANDHPVDLLETLAQQLADFLLAEYQLPWLKLTIGKPGAVHNAINVGVEIERSRQS